LVPCPNFAVRTSVRFRTERRAPCRSRDLPSRVPARRQGPRLFSTLGEYPQPSAMPTLNGGSGRIRGPELGLRACQLCPDSQSPPDQDADPGFCAQWSLRISVCQYTLPGLCTILRLRWYRRSVTRSPASSRRWICPSSTSDVPNSESRPSAFLG